MSLPNFDKRTKRDSSKSKKKNGMQQSLNEKYKQLKLTDQQSSDVKTAKKAE